MNVVRGSREMSQQDNDKLAENYGIRDGDVPWHQTGREDRPGFSMRSMGLEGYKRQVEARLHQFGYTGAPPSDRLYLEAWNAQRCAKGLARGFIRRNRKLRRR